MYLVCRQFFGNKIGIGGMKMKDNYNAENQVDCIKNILTIQFRYAIMQMKSESDNWYVWRYEMDKGTIQAIMVWILLIVVTGLGNHFIDGM